MPTSFTVSAWWLAPSRLWCLVYDVENGDVLTEHVFDRVEDPHALVPLPTSAVEWTDAEFCRLVAARRNSVRGRFALPPLGSPCEIAR